MKKSILLFGLIVCAANSITAQGFSHHPLEQLSVRSSLISDPIPPIIAQVSDTSIAGLIRGLEAFGTRHMSQPNRFQVANWIRDRFLGAGITDVALDSFQYNGEWQVNVVATIAGTTEADREIIVGGHYDSYSWDVARAPGADDNASGTAAVIEMARILTLTGYVPNTTLRFIAFGAEEAGLIGSDHYASMAADSGRQIALMQNYDMIGHRIASQGDRDVLVVWYQGAEAEASLDSTLKRQYTTLTPVMSTDYRDRSDSWPFHSRRYKAVFNIEADFSSVYHTPEDRSTLLDFGYAAEIVKSGLALLLATDDRQLSAYKNISGIPDTLDFGAVNLGYPDTLLVKIKNKYGPNPLVASSVTIDHEAISVSPSSFSVPLHGQETIRLIFSPAFAGPVAAQLNISSNDSASPSKIITLTGTGQVAPLISAMPDSISLALFSGRSATRTLTISNTGGSSLSFTTDIVTEELGTPGGTGFSPADPSSRPEKVSFTAEQTAGEYQPPVVRGTLQPEETSGNAPTHQYSPLNAPIGAPQAGGEGSAAPDTNMMASATLAASTPVGFFYESFELSSLVNWDFGWASAVREITSETAVRGSRSFHYANSDWGHFGGVSRTFLPGTRPEKITFYVRPGSTSLADAYFVLTDEFGYECIWFFAHEYGRLYVNDDVGGDNSYSYNALTWYRIEFRNIDWQAATFDYYVNRTLVKANIPMRNAHPNASLGSLQLYNFHPSEAWYDGIDIGGRGDWITANPASGIVPPGSTMEVQIQVNSEEMPGGEHRGRIVLKSDDPAHPELSVPVRLTVTDAPTLAADTSFLDFGKQLIGVPDTLQVAVHNRGNQDLLIFSATIQPAAYRVSPAFAGVDPGEEEVFTVIFLPQTVADYPGALTLTSNDPAEGTVVVSLFGTGSQLLLTKPIGGERWFVGMKRLIEWQSVNTTEIALDYSTDNGSTWLPIASQIDASSSSYEWTVPPTPSPHCRIRITDVTDPSHTDMSASPFTIALMPPLSEGLVAYYPFNGNSNDEGAHGYHATNLGATLTADRYGNPASAYHFDGQSTLYVPHDSAFSFRHEYTFSFWTRLTDPMRNQKLVAKSMGTALGYPGYIFGVADGGIYAETYDETGLNHGFITDSTFEANTWVHMAITYRVGDEMKAYLNGGLVHRMPTSSSPIGTNDMPLYIGSWSFYHGLLFNDYYAIVGDLDDIRIYDRVLSDEEIQVLFLEDAPTGVDAHSKSIPIEFALSQNFPNPFNPTTVIRYELPDFSRVTLKVYDMLGREVAVLVNGEKAAGFYQAEWNATVASGVYFYRLEAVGKNAKSFVETKKMVLLR